MKVKKLVTWSRVSKLALLLIAWAVYIFGISSQENELKNQIALAFLIGLSISVIIVSAMEHYLTEGLRHEAEKDFARTVEHAEAHSVSEQTALRKAHMSFGLWIAITAVIFALLLTVL